MGSRKKQPTPPPAPDPKQLAQIDADYNRIDQVTPFGSLTYGGPNRNQATLEFSPELQNIFNLQNQSSTNLLNSAIGAQGGIDQLMQNPLNTQGLPELNSPNMSGMAQLPQNFDAYRGDAERAFFDRSSGLLNEQFGRQEDQLRQTLANQGLQSGGEAFGREMGDFNQRRGETFSNLARDAVMFGGQEASRSLAGQMGLRGQQFGEAQQGFQNDASIRSQLLGERGAVRSNQFNELASLLGLNQVQQPGLQNFFSPSQVNTVDPYALQQQNLMNTYNQQSGQAGSKKGAGANLAGMLGSAALMR